MTRLDQHFSAFSKFAVSILFILLFSFPLHSQGFQFGLKAGYLASQIDGDNLKGFDKSGIMLGALGGFAVNDRQWVVVECTYQSFGSSIKDENKSLTAAGMRDLYIWDMSSASVFLGFSQHLGQKPIDEPSLKFRFIGGLRAHGIVKKEVEVRHPVGIMADQTIEAADVKRFMVGLSLGAGVFIRPNLILDIAYDYSLSNLLIKPELDDMRVLPDILPYYYSLGISYYLSNGSSKKKKSHRRRRRR